MKKLLLLLFIPTFGYSQQQIDITKLRIVESTYDHLPLSMDAVQQQTKNTMHIGNIEVSDSLALEYLADCYIHPDTISLRLISPSDTYEVGYGYDTQTHKFVYPLENFEYNDSIRRISIGKYMPHEYSSIDEMIHTFSMVYHLVPRKPSDVDFVKWIHSLKK